MINLFNSLGNDPKQDIPTLMELLQSPNFLKPFAKENNLNAVRLGKNLDMKLIYGKGGRTYNTKGTIKVTYFSGDRDEGILILNKLKDYFLEEALNERRKKLNSGIEFLKSQAPKLSGKRDALQEELSEFRKKYNNIEPVAEGQILESS